MVIETTMEINETMICVERYTRKVSVGRVSLYRVGTHPGPVGRTCMITYTRHRDRIFLLPSVEIFFIYKHKKWSAWLD